MGLNKLLIELDAEKKKEIENLSNSIKNVTKKLAKIREKKLQAVNSYNKETMDLIKNLSKEEADISSLKVNFEKSLRDIKKTTFPIPKNMKLTAIAKSNIHIEKTNSLNSKGNQLRRKVVITKYSKLPVKQFFYSTPLNKLCVEVLDKENNRLSTFAEQFFYPELKKMSEGAIRYEQRTIV